MECEALANNNRIKEATKKDHYTGVRKERNKMNYTLIVSSKN
jgi:hypothetical protein